MLYKLLSTNRKRKVINKTLGQKIVVFPEIVLFVSLLSYILGVFCSQTLFLFGYVVYGPVKPCMSALSLAYICLNSYWSSSRNNLVWLFQIQPQFKIK